MFIIRRCSQSSRSCFPLQFCKLGKDKKSPDVCYLGWCEVRTFKCNVVYLLLLSDRLCFSIWLSRSEFHFRTYVSLSLVLCQ